jgi:mannose-1-phosphate guanylyltransferase
MHPKEVTIDLGVIENSGGWVSAYREKPSLNYEVSMGVYVYDTRALDYLPEGPCQFPELVQRLLDADQPVAAYSAKDTEWFDIGTVGELERATERLIERPDLFDLRLPVRP